MGNSAYCLNPGDDNSIVIGANARGKGSNTTVIGNADSRGVFMGTTQDTITDGATTKGYLLFVNENGEIVRSRNFVNIPATPVIN